MHYKKIFSQGQKYPERNFEISENRNKKSLIGNGEKLQGGSI